MAARRTIVTHVSAQAFEPRAPLALRNLGYEIVAAGGRSRRSNPSIAPDLRIVDERSLGKIPMEEGGAPIPIVLLTRRSVFPDPRIVAALSPPATLRGLYPVLQRALETKPRLAPRITTGLPARYTHDGRSWSGVVLSLSETGCSPPTDGALRTPTRSPPAKPPVGHGQAPARPTRFLRRAPARVATRDRRVRRARPRRGPTGGSRSECSAAVRRIRALSQGLVGGGIVNRYGQLLAAEVEHGCPRSRQARTPNPFGLPAA
jgi:hypothetical protein